MLLSELQESSYQTALKSGFHATDTFGSVLVTALAGTELPTGVFARLEAAIGPVWAELQASRRIMLMVSELSEAFEELRKGHPADYEYVSGLGKPEGVPSELADVVIRVLDFCGTAGIDLTSVITGKQAYNQTRERMHGKRF